MNLPETFINRMNSFFKETNTPSEGFYESFDKVPLKGVRLNRSKVAEEDYSSVISSLGEEVNKVTWCSSGFYTTNESSGNDPYYHAGVYYPTEPSAMLPAQVMAAKPGDMVLDLCAAPGGKACRLGEDLKGEGLLIANEINENRAKALLRNIERMGINNCVILNETPEKLAVNFAGFFDKILVDAPCSGEGMFRRDPSAVKSWEKFGPVTCMKMQNEILESTHRMLKAGGELVYSTCTFCEGEDEDMILAFMEKYPEYEIIPHPELVGVSHAGPDSKLPGSMRIWPHLSEGDGHFCVHLRKKDDAVVEEYELSKIPSYKKKRNDNYGFGKSRETLCNFMAEILVKEKAKEYADYIKDKFIMHGNRLHILSVPERLFDGLKVVKLGEFPGEIKPTTTERIFIPSHSLALGLKYDDIRKDSIISLGRDSELTIRYLKGETINIDFNDYPELKKKGTVIIAVDKYPVGFGKITSDGSVKNLYPKAWRLV